MKNKNRIISMVLLLAMILTTIASVVQPVYAQDTQEVKVFVDNTEVLFPDVQPRTEDGEILLPLRFVLEELGMDVYWSNESMEVTAIKTEQNGSKKVVILQPYSDKMVVNGNIYTLSTKVVFQDGRNLIPGADLVKALNDIYYKEEKPSVDRQEGYYYNSYIEGADEKYTDIPEILEYTQDVNLEVLTPENETTLLGNLRVVQFDLGGGEGNVETQIVNSNENITIPGNEGVTKVGFMFNGWVDKNYINPYGGYIVNYTRYKPNDTFNVTEDTTFVAQWVDSKIVYFDGVSIDSRSADPIYLYSDTDVVVMPEYQSYTEVGKKFIGWTDDGNSRYNPYILYKVGYTYNHYDLKVDETNPFNKIFLQSAWELNQYKISFNGNGSTVGTVPNDIDYTLIDEHGTNLTVTMPGQGDLVKEDYTFLGWSKDPNATTATLSSFETVEATSMLQGTWYAVWDGAVEYRLSFKGNGASSGSAPEDVVVYDEQSYLGFPTQGNLTKEGYEFLGWSSNQLARTPEYYAWDNRLPSEINLGVYYAVWQEVSQTGSVTVQYYELASGTYVGTIVSEYVVGNHTIYATDIPEGYRLISWETNPKEITINAGDSQLITFYVEQGVAVGEVFIEKWVDSSWTYYSNSVFLPVGTHTINADDYYTEPSYVLTGESSKIVEVLEGQTTFIRFDYKTPPQGFINLIVKTEGGKEVGNSSFNTPIGTQTIRLNEWWYNPLYEVVGETEKAVEVTEGSTAVVEFTVRKLASGYVHKIGMYNGQVIVEEVEELGVGTHTVWAPWGGSLYEATEMDKQVVVVEGETVDVVFEFTKLPTYFVQKIGKDNVSNAVLYDITKELPLYETGFGAEWFENENIYTMLGDYWINIESPTEGETIEVEWLYEKVATGWVRVIGYDEGMAEIYNELVEIRAEGDFVYAPEISTGDTNTNYQPNIWDEWVGETSSTPETAPTVNFYYTLNVEDTPTEPEVPNEDANIIFSSDVSMLISEAPIIIRVHVDATGELTIAETYELKNLSPLGMIKIVSINMEESNGWVMVDYDNNFISKRANSKEFGIKINNIKGINNTFEIREGLSEPIRNGESMPLNIEMKIAPQKDSIENGLEIAQIVFIVDFY